MKLGFMTNILVKHGMDTLEEIGSWALSHGFTDLEVGPTIPLDREMYEKVLSTGISITSLTYCRNYLSSDEEEAKHHLEELKKRIRFAAELGIEKIVTSTGIDRTIEEGVYDRADSIRKIPIRSLDRFLKVFDPVVELAEEKGVCLAFENCPLMGNIAISPVMWREMFKRLDSSRVGLAYDPSHLVWQFINPYDPIIEFAPKIFHFHAKDTTINRSKLEERGFLTDFDWWSYRISGQGELDWKRLFKLLNEIGYDRTVSLEHEDKVYSGSLEAVQQGMLLAGSYIEAIMNKGGGN